MKSFLPGSLACGGPWLVTTLFLPLLLLPAVAFAQQSTAQLASDANVNSRYVIQDVSIAGVDVKLIDDPHLSPELRRRLLNLIGNTCNFELLQDLANRVRKELRVKAVDQRLSRGTAPDTVRVNFEITRRSVELDISVPKFLYHSKQGWSGELDASTKVQQNVFTFGLVSDGDELTERYAGLVTRYENLHVGTDRLRFKFEFDTFHEQWNRATLQALAAQGAGAPAVYRTRVNIQPLLTFILLKSLTLSGGASFEQMEPLRTAGPRREEAANSLLALVRYHRRRENGGAVRQDFDGEYQLRVAARFLGSDYVYSRHKLRFSYRVAWGRQSITDEFLAGAIAGRTPLFEQFVLGTTSTLRGWNRYSIDPFGGSRVIHNSVTYAHRIGPGLAEGFYDAGALWNAGEPAPVRQSVGVGYRQSIFSLALAFPLREGRIDPVFMVGMNY